MHLLDPIDVRIEDGGVGYPVLFVDDAGPAVVETLRTLDIAACAVIADATVARLHAARLMAAFGAAKPTAALLQFAAGEPSKNRSTWAELSDRMLEHGLGRDGAVVALGGGVACDLAGFVAATYMRGVPLVQVPTTLLAMVDASVGGKTALDVPAGKNLVGAFHHPSAVVICPAFLETLPDALVADGLVEALKHGAIADASYFERVAAEVERVRSHSAAVHWLIHRSIEIKATVVCRDPYERGERAILNFGHTIGHGLEHAADYACGHGSAVARGMELEARLGERLGVTRPGTSQRLRQALEPLGLDVPRPDPDAVLAAMTRDKKNRRAELRMVLLDRIGRVARDAAGSWTHAVERETVERVLREPGPRDGV